MKFSPAAAAALLSRRITEEKSSVRGRLTTLPISDIIQVEPKVPIHHHDRRRHRHKKTRFGLQWNAALKNTPSVPHSAVLCDTTSFDADTGLLSCGEGYFCKPLTGSKISGLCTTISRNQDQTATGDESRSFLPWQSLWMNHQLSYETETPLVLCDPAPLHGDSLSCKVDEFCKPEEASELGGFCVPTSVVSRGLITLEDWIGLCDPMLDYMTSGCDCSGLDTVSGTGTIVCLEESPVDFHGCDKVMVDYTYSITFEDSVLLVLRDCYDIKVPYSLNFCVTSYGEYMDDSCAIEWNGQVCNSCAINHRFYDFDCSNVDGGPTGSSVVEFSSIFAQCYTKPNYTCTNICGDGHYIPDDNFNITVTYLGYGEVSCGLAAYLEENALITDYQCNFVMKAAQNACCMPLNTTAPDLEEDSVPTVSGPEGDSTTTSAKDSEVALPSTAFNAFLVCLLTSMLLYITSA